MQPAGERAWLGDLLFFASSILWAGFTLLLRHWRVPALRATAVVSVLSFLIATPSYLAWAGTAHLQALPLGCWPSRDWCRAGFKARSPWSPTARP